MAACAILNLNSQRSVVDAIKSVVNAIKSDFFICRVYGAGDFKSLSCGMFAGLGTSRV